MTLAIDGLLIVAILLVLTKAGALILRPYQQKRFNNLFESLTLWIDSLNPIIWIKKSHDEKFHFYYIFIGSIPIFIFFNYKLSLVLHQGYDEPHHFFWGAISAWMLALIISSFAFFILLKLLSKPLNPSRIFCMILMMGFGFRLFDNAALYLMSFTSYFFTAEVFAYPDIKGVSKESIIIAEEAIPPVLYGLYIVFHLLSIFLFFAFCYLEIYIALIFVWMVLVLFGGLIQLSKLVLWRICEFDKGPYFGFLAFAGVVLAIWKAVT